MSNYVTGFYTKDGVKKYDYNSLANLPESGTDITNTVISPNADYAEVGEWSDGNPNKEPRLGYFVAIAEVGDNTIKIRKATSTDDVRGVSVYNPAFSGNASRDKYGEDGELLPQYNYIGVMGIVEIIDNGRCDVNGRCMPDDNGTAIPSTNNMGYAVLERVDSTHVLIAVEPGADMIQRVKKDIENLEEQIGKGGGGGGVSPTVSVTEIESGHRLTITDVNGAQSFDVLDGAKGDDGYTPQKGEDYFTEEDIEEVATKAAGKVNALPLSGGTLTGQLKVQSGNPNGALVIGADVSANTVTEGKRKLGRVVMPVQENSTVPLLVLSADTMGDGSSTIGGSGQGHNRVEFGGRLGANTTTSPDSMAFTIAKSHNATDIAQKVYALEMNAEQARFNVQPKYGDKNLLTEDNLSDLATVDKVTEIDTWYDTREGVSDDGDGIQWTDTFAFLDDGGDEIKTGLIYQKIPITAGENITFSYDEENNAIAINATGGGSSTDDSMVGTWVFSDESLTHAVFDVSFEFVCGGTLFNRMFNSDESEMLLHYANANNDIEMLAYDSRWEDDFFKTITINEEPTDETFKSWLKANATKQGGGSIDTSNLATVDKIACMEQNQTVNSVSCSKSGIFWMVDGRMLDMDDFTIAEYNCDQNAPIAAGKGISFEVDDVNTVVKINAQGTIDKIIQMDTWYDGTTGICSDDRGISWADRVYIEAETTEADAEYYARVPIVAGDNVTFSVDEDNQVVKINAANGVKLVTMYTSYPTPTIADIITAIQEAGGDVGAVNFVQFTGFLQDCIAVQMKHYGGDTYKVTCVILSSLTLIYNADTGNVISASGTRIGDFLNYKISLTDVNDKTVDKIGYVDTWFNGPYEVSYDTYGISWTDVIEFELPNDTYHTTDIFFKTPLVAGDNVLLEADNENNVVKIHSLVGEICEAYSEDGVSYTANSNSIIASDMSQLIGRMITIIPNKTSTAANATLNVNGLGAKGLKRRNINQSGDYYSFVSASWLTAGYPIQVMYNGTYWLVESMPQPLATDLKGRVPVANGGVPTCSTSDNGKVLKVVNGVPTWVTA